MIPIQPKWAKDLFDEELATQYIFGSQIQLALKRKLYIIETSGLMVARTRCYW